MCNLFSHFFLFFASFFPEKSAKNQTIRKRIQVKKKRVKKHRISLDDLKQSLVEMCFNISSKECSEVFRIFQEHQKEKKQKINAKTLDFSTVLAVLMDHTPIKVSHVSLPSILNVRGRDVEFENLDKQTKNALDIFRQHSEQKFKTTYDLWKFFDRKKNGVIDREKLILILMFEIGEVFEKNKRI